MDLATLRNMHQDWDIVSFIEGPRGQGIYALGRDGGVFALDSTGGTSGLTAPVIPGGSFTALPAGDRQATSPFTEIRQNQNGGYVLVNANQQQYNFNGPAPAPPVAATPANTTGTTQATDTTPTATPGENLSGTAALHAVLDPLGLGGLIPDALLELAKPGATADYVTQVWLPAQKSFTDRFPEIGAAQAKNAGGTPTHIPTPAEIVAYHQGIQGMVDTGMLPAEFADPTKVSQLINGGVSLPEFQNRVLNGYDKFMNADPADQAAFLAYHPAVDIAHSVGMILDPTLGEAAVNRAITQAQIGGSAIRSGYGSLSLGQATTLEQAGLTGASAQSGLTNLALEKPLFTNLAGETGSIGQDEQLATLTGDATSISEIERRRAARGAAFAGGGGAASGGQGSQGLGASGQ